MHIYVEALKDQLTNLTWLWGDKMLHMRGKIILGSSLVPFNSHLASPGIFPSYYSLRTIPWIKLQKPILPLISLLNNVEFRDYFALQST